MITHRVVVVENSSREHDSRNVNFQHNANPDGSRDAIDTLNNITPQWANSNRAKSTASAAVESISTSKFVSRSGRRSPCQDLENRQRKGTMNVADHGALTETRDRRCDGDNFWTKQSAVETQTNRHPFFTEFGWHNWVWAHSRQFEFGTFVHSQLNIRDQTFLSCLEAEKHSNARYYKRRHFFILFLTEAKFTVASQGLRQLLQQACFHSLLSVV